MEIREGLVRDNPSVTQLQSDLAENHLYLAFLVNSMGHPAEAVTSCRRALEISERLAHDHPSVHAYQRILGITLYDFAAFEIDQGRWQDAREHLERAIACQRAALAAMPRHPDHQRALRADLLALTKVYHSLNQTADAMRTTQELVALAQKNPSDLYDVACALAQSAALSPGEPRQALTVEAVQTLKQAIAAGWNDAGRTSRDPELALLRKRDDFRRLLAELFDRGFPVEPFVP